MKDMITVHIFMGLAIIVDGDRITVADGEMTIMIEMILLKLMAGQLRLPGMRDSKRRWKEVELFYGYFLLYPRFCSFRI